MVNQDSRLFQKKTKYKKWKEFQLFEKQKIKLNLLILINTLTKNWPEDFNVFL